MQEEITMGGGEKSEDRKKGGLQKNGKDGEGEKKQRIEKLIASEKG